MGHNLKFLVLDGDDPAQWKPESFSRPFHKLMNFLSEQRLTVFTADRVEDELNFEPIYVPRDTWDTLKGVDEVTGLIIDGKSLSDGVVVEKLRKLLRYISISWKKSPVAMCKSIGSVELWLVAEKSDAKEILQRWGLLLPDIINAYATEIDVKFDVIWREDIFETHIPAFLVRAHRNGSRSGGFKNGG